VDRFHGLVGCGIRRWKDAGSRIGRAALPPGGSSSGIFRDRKAMGDPGAYPVLRKAEAKVTCDADLLPSLRRRAIVRYRHIRCRRQGSNSEQERIDGKSRAAFGAVKDSGGDRCHSCQPTNMDSGHSWNDRRQFLPSLSGVGFHCFIPLPYGFVLRGLALAPSIYRRTRRLGLYRLPGAGAMMPVD
jgi:hypothetical protein